MNSSYRSPRARPSPSRAGLDPCRRPRRGGAARAAPWPSGYRPFELARARPDLHPNRRDAIPREYGAAAGARQRGAIPRNRVGGDAQAWLFEANRAEGLDIDERTGVTKWDAWPMDHADAVMLGLQAGGALEL